MTSTVTGFSCLVAEKGRNLQSQGAVGGIVLDNVPGTSTAGNPLFAMSGDGNDDITIPMLFLFSVDGKTLLRAMVAKEDLEVTMAEVEGEPGQSCPTNDIRTMFANLPNMT